MTDSAPKIVVFHCSWCFPALAAPSETLKPGANLMFIRTMCSGRLEPAFIMQAFRSGADGVMVVGCPLEECHYQRGSYKTLRRVSLLKSLLSEFGIESERLRLEFVGSTELNKFQEVVGKFSREIDRLGRLNLTIHAGVCV